MEEVVDDVIGLLNREFGAQSELTVSSGTLHDSLSMILDFPKARQLQVNMIRYIMLVLDEVPDEMKGTAVTPTASHVFQVDDGSVQLLDGDQKDLFHHITMQLAYLSQHVWPNIQIV